MNYGPLDNDSALASYFSMGNLGSRNGNPNLRQSFTDLMNGGSFSGGGFSDGGSSGIFGNFLNQYNADGKMIGQGWGMPAFQIASGLMGAYQNRQNFKQGKLQADRSWQAYQDNRNAQHDTLKALATARFNDSSTLASRYQNDLASYLDQTLPKRG
jgi:hypothetical protein